MGELDQYHQNIFDYDRQVYDIIQKRQEQNLIKFYYENWDIYKLKFDLDKLEQMSNDVNEAFDSLGTSV